MNPIIQKVVFDKPTCDFFVNYFESNTHIDKKGPGLYKNAGETAIVRVKDIPGEFLTYLKPFNVSYVNFQETHNSTFSLKINKYYTGTSFPEHRDNSAYNLGTKDESRTKRWKTFIWQLSPEDSYRGGDLLIEGNPMNRQQGNCICFDSNLIHSVTEITTGERYSLVLWLEKNNFSSTQSSIL